VDDPELLLDYWLNDIGPKGWYAVDQGVDDTIRERFGDTWRRAQEKGQLGWTSSPRRTLALLILLDQFPRNMFRGSGQSYASDRIARQVARKAIDKGFDLRVAEPERQFFYLPLMHSENLADQERCVRLIRERLSQGGEENLLHARAHRDVIRRFGRFPHRNTELNRAPTPTEREYLKGGGYPALVRSMQEGI
jgi:uncharacterized protein (DUF924 family)